MKWVVLSLRRLGNATDCPSLELYRAGLSGMRSGSRTVKRGGSYDNNITVRAGEGMLHVGGQMHRGLVESREPRWKWCGENVRAFATGWAWSIGPVPICASVLPMIQS